MRSVSTKLPAPAPPAPAAAPAAAPPALLPNLPPLTTPRIQFESGLDQESITPSPLVALSLNSSVNCSSPSPFSAVTVLPIVVSALTERSLPAVRPRAMRTEASVSVLATATVVAAVTVSGASTATPTSSSDWALAEILMSPLLLNMPFVFSATVIEAAVVCASTPTPKYRWLAL